MWNYIKKLYEEWIDVQTELAKQGYFIYYNPYDVGVICIRKDTEDKKTPE